VPVSFYIFDNEQQLLVLAVALVFIVHHASSCRIKFYSKKTSHSM